MGDTVFALVTGFGVRRKDHHVFSTSRRPNPNTRGCELHRLVWDPSSFTVPNTEVEHRRRRRHPATGT